MCLIVFFLFLIHTDLLGEAIQQILRVLEKAVYAIYEPPRGKTNNVVSKQV